MKKIIFTLIGVFLTFALFSAKAEETIESAETPPKFFCAPSEGIDEASACGLEKDVEEMKEAKETIKVSEKESQKEMMTELPNPLEKITLKEFTAETGYWIRLPENEFKEVEITRINTIPVLYDISFTYEDKKRYTFRMSPQSAGKDISGMHYKWTHTQEKDDGKVCMTDNGKGIILWTEKTGMQYCVIMKEKATEDALKKMRRRIIQSWELDE